MPAKRPRVVKTKESAQPPAPVAELSSADAELSPPQATQLPARSYELAPVARHTLIGAPE